MNSKYSCVIDAKGFYKTIVELKLLPVYSPPSLRESKMEWVVQNYELKDGERLVPRTEDCRQPTQRPYVGVDGFITPRWDDKINAWIEGATHAEFAAWEISHPAPFMPQTPTLEQRTTAMEQAMLTLLGGNIDV